MLIIRNCVVDYFNIILKGTAPVYSQGWFFPGEMSFFFNRDILGLLNPGQFGEV